MVFPERYEAKSPPQWATLIPDRAPEFKVHTSLGLAHSAIAYHKPHSEVALYHLESDALGAYWQKTWEYVFPETCSNCGNAPSPSRRGNRFYLPFRYEGIVKDAPVVCDNCYYETQNKAKREQQQRAEKAELARLQKKYG